MRGPHRRGSLLLEALVAIGLFAIFLGGIGLTLVVGERSTVSSGDRVRATFLAEQTMEGVRNMAAKNFASITAGSHGVQLINGAWAFTGTLIKTPEGYQAHADIVSKGTEWWEVRVASTWSFDKSRSGAVLLTSYLTNWRKTLPIGNWSLMSRIGLVTDAGTPEYQKIAISGNYAFITSLHSSGGKGLYVYDISNPAAPVRVSSSFDLGASAYELAISDTQLFLATDDTTKEVQVYDISTPTSLTTGNLMKSYDLPGSGKARAVAFYDTTIFVGTLTDASNPQFYTLQWSESNPISLLDTLSLSGSVTDISLHEGYAYATTSYNAGELQVIDVFDASNLAFAPGTGLDMTEVFDGSAVNTFGTSAIIGRLQGSTIDEVTLYSIADAPVPTPPPGPWSIDAGGSALSLASVYGGKYAFLGSDASSAQLRVLDMAKFVSGASPVVKTYNAQAAMRGLYYNWLTDRLFGVTPSSLMVFAPG